MQYDPAVALVAIVPVVHVVAVAVVAVVTVVRVKPLPVKTKDCDRPARTPLVSCDSDAF